MDLDTGAELHRSSSQSGISYGQSIERLEIHEDGTLILSFGSDKRITILDSSKDYESYNITRPGQTIIV